MMQSQKVIPTPATWLAWGQPSPRRVGFPPAPAASHTPQGSDQWASGTTPHPARQFHPHPACHLRDCARAHGL